MCTNDCIFCLRKDKDDVCGQRLWLDSENYPVEDVLTQFDSCCQFHLSCSPDIHPEIVFCGYGEPTNSFDVLVKTAQYIRSKLGIKIRVNTNGLGSLVNGRDISAELCSNVDAVSISLNCSNKEDYLKTVRPKFGIESFDEMLDFAKKCRALTENVALSVVDVIGEEEVEKCKNIAEGLNIPLRVRKYDNSSDN